jgi:hypothetical protein
VIVPCEQSEQLIDPAPEYEPDAHVPEQAWVDRPVETPNFPAAHAAQVLALPSANLPAEQLRHDELPATAYVPGLHEAVQEASMRPVVAPYSPGPQFVQNVAAAKAYCPIGQSPEQAAVASPVSDPYFPAEQLVQIIEFLRENIPAAQKPEHAAVESPGYAPNIPALQSVQKLAELRENFPDAQIEQTDSLSFEKEPELQPEQIDIPVVAAKYPEAQFTHSADPKLENNPSEHLSVHAVLVSPDDEP